MAWTLELVFWIVVLVGYALLSWFHAEPYTWVAGLVVLAAMALAIEWNVATYRCPECKSVATRREHCKQRVASGRPL